MKLKAFSLCSKKRIYLVGFRTVKYTDLSVVEGMHKQPWHSQSSAGALGIPAGKHQLLGSSAGDSRHLLGINNKSLQKAPRTGPRRGSAAVPKEGRAGSGKEQLSQGRVLQQNVGHLVFSGRADVVPLLREGSLGSDHSALHPFKDLHHFSSRDAALSHDGDATFPEGQQTSQYNPQKGTERNIKEHPAPAKPLKIKLCERTRNWSEHETTNEH